MCTGVTLEARRVSNVGCSLYDLTFSEDQFYIDQRAEFVGGVRHCIEQAKEGYHNPGVPTVYVRKPFKILLGILMFVLFLAVHNSKDEREKDWLEERSN